MPKSIFFSGRDKGDDGREKVGGQKWCKCNMGFGRVTKNTHLTSLHLTSPHLSSPRLGKDVGRSTKGLEGDTNTHTHQGQKANWPKSNLMELAYVEVGPSRIGLGRNWRK